MYKDDIFGFIRIELPSWSIYSGCIFILILIIIIFNITELDAKTVSGNLK